MFVFDDITALHKRLAKSEKAFEIVFTHCQIVWEVARQLIERRKLSVDADFIRAGCFVHDIGAYSFISPEGVFDGPNYIKHGVTGYDILKSAGFPEELCRIAERHTGTGITMSQIQERGLPLPMKDYMAETLEEKLIMYADKFHSKTPKFNTAQSYRAYLGRFGEESVRRFDELVEMFGVPDLQGLSAQYRQPIV